MRRRDTEGSGADAGDERSYWSSVDSSHRRGLAVGLAVAVAIAVVGGLLFALSLGKGRPERDLGGPATILGGPPADASTGTVASASGSATAVPAVEASAVSAVATGASTFTRAAKVAFRKDGWLWVAGEDGSRAKKVAQAASGSFALSPDGSVLAYEDSAHSLRLAGVTDGSSRNAGPMRALGRISWAPSSAWLAYEGVPGGRRVGRDGSANAPLGITNGAAFSVSPDGTKVAAMQVRRGFPNAVVFVDAKGGAVETARGADSPAAFAWLGPRSIAVILIGISTQGETVYPVGAVAVPGGAFAAVATHAAESRAQPSVMFASSDGHNLAWADTGDDGYSRTYLLDVSGEKRCLAVSKRYDTYPLGWSADGRRLLAIEGNAWQGQPTRLISVAADGLDKRVIVEGAGL